MAGVLRNMIITSLLYSNLPSALAHMEMSWPYAFRSKFNPNITNPDYDNTSPLLSDGSNYPCKGYQDLASSQTAVVSYNPGQIYNLTLAGSAIHGGGSCQISLSYDDGQTFHVIKSMIGGCPLKDDWDFTIPSYAPPSQSVILAWTWFNLIGNREMYMQCARVAITGQAVQRYRRSTSTRQISVDQLPENFACNIDNGCATLEDHEVIFPNPGDIIERGTDLYSPLAGPGYTLTTIPTGTGFNDSTPTSTTTFAMITSTGSGSTLTTVYYSSTSTLTVTSSTSTPTASIPGQFFGTYYNSSTTTRVTTSVLYPNTTSTTLTTNQTPDSTSIITSASVSATTIPGPCTPGHFACNSPTTFSQCVSTGDSSTSYIFMGQVATGMQCINGTIVRGNDGPCTPDGLLQCNGSQSFYLCTNGGLINMGPVAPGTACSNGTIVFA